jgi:hypothetical protein
MAVKISTTVVAALTAMVMGLAGCSGGNDGNAGNGGAYGAAPERYMGTRSNVNATWNGQTSSSTMLEQRIKEDSARGATSGGGNTKY